MRGPLVQFLPFAHPSSSVLPRLADPFTLETRICDPQSPKLQFFLPCLHRSPPSICKRSTSLFSTVSPPFRETRITSMAYQNRIQLRWPDPEHHLHGHGNAHEAPSIYGLPTVLRPPADDSFSLSSSSCPPMLPKSWTWMRRPHMLPLTGSAPNQALFAFRPLLAPQFSPLLRLTNRSPRPHLDLTVRPFLSRSTTSLKNKIDQARSERDGGFDQRNGFKRNRDLASNV
jgi:hypothetical protein